MSFEIMSSDQMNERARISQQFAGNLSDFRSPLVVIATTFAWLLKFLTQIFVVFLQALLINGF